MHTEQIYSDPASLQFAQETRAKEATDIHEYYAPDAPVKYDEVCVARFGDETWCLEEHELKFFGQEHPDGLSRQIANESKAVMYCWMFESGNTIAINTIKAHGYSLLQLGRLAYEHNCGLFQFLENFELLRECLPKMGNRSYVELLSARSDTVSDLLKLRGKIFRKSQLKREVAKIVADSYPEKRQTLLMPSRIYIGVLTNLVSGLKKIESDLEILQRIVELKDKGILRYPDSIKVNRPFNDRIAPDECAEVTKLGRDLGLLSEDEIYDNLYWNYFQERITQHYTHLHLTIAAFTGMRHEETRALKVDCLSEKRDTLGNIHYEISGLTTKTMTGVLPFVTCEAGARAVKLAIDLRHVRMALLSNKGDKDQGYVFCMAKSLAKPAKLSTKTSREYWNKISLDIISADIDELDFIIPDRDWKVDGVEAGKRWPLAPHQFRRSLAVYAHRSGLVTEATLKTQFKHLSLEMTRYYARDFIRAANILDGSGFAKEFESGRIEASVQSYMYGLTRVEPRELLGAGAKMVHSPKVKDSPVSVFSRSHLTELIERGEVAYRETPLGGCTSTRVCNDSPMNDIATKCITENCKHLVINEKKLDRQIKIQQMLVDELKDDADSAIELKFETEILTVMEKAKNTLPRAA